jgi:magnesium chelatase family protein
MSVNLNSSPKSVDQLATTSKQFATSGPTQEQSHKSAANLPVSRVLSSCLLGVEAVGVEVEAKVVGGKNQLRIVGLPDGVLREARERVRCAILNSGFFIPNGEVVVSLSPAELPKTGSGFDLAIALAILSADGQINRRALIGKVFLGEVALDGRLRKTKGALAAGIYIKDKSQLSLIVSSANAQELAILKNERIRVAETLSEVVSAINGKTTLQRPPANSSQSVLACGPTFKDVKGHQAAIRVCEIAAAGGHNLLFIGPPGSGKSMLAERIPSILPPLREEELLEVLSIYDAHFNKRESQNMTRPFRSPHHTCSTPGLIGGGAGPAPGEISLAHRGILFLDELPEFKREGLESLRQPLEERKLTLSRANKRITFPADFALIAAMNPCPCGKRGAPNGGCRCGISAIKSYLNKISGPLLERIDLQFWLNPPKIDELAVKQELDRTEQLKEKVSKAREIQVGRGNKLNSQLNATEVEKYAELENDAQGILNSAAKQLNLSARGFVRTIRVARTIADLEGRERVGAGEIAEALSYRLKIEELVN